MTAQQDLGWGSRAMEMDIAFTEFHAENPEVWQLFQRFTFEVIRRGFKQYSARAVAHRIRWEAHVREGRSDFKLNNNHVRRYALMFMRRNPQHVGIFRTRKPKED